MSRHLNKNANSFAKQHSLPCLQLIFVLGLGTFTIASILSIIVVGRLFEYNEPESMLHAHPQLLAVRKLDHEEMFRKTVKSCLPSRKSNCKTFIPDINGTKTQRVALISPSGGAASSFFNELIQPMTDSYNRRRDKGGPIINAFVRFDVPPYGYGKTHGLTKIIRLVPQPLMLEVTEALQSLLPHGDSFKHVTMQDTKAILRQILRFHCRLSAVAAHTALLSVDYLDLTADADVELEKFLFADDLLNGKVKDKKSYKRKRVYTEASFLSQFLTHLQSKSLLNVYDVFDQVLVDELAASKNLTIWPCPSFWSVGDAPNPFDISPLVQRLAKALSPNCSEPLADCWVARDKCEASGDGPCKSTKG
ncbi:hypothetical protein MPSEU_000276700 [Mayamaea pseudoterrestris]|nr:hypothetical protein MPSEU_000276700 [Mayamaea pseudoterrestris]